MSAMDGAKTKAVFTNTGIKTDDQYHIILKLPALKDSA